jgi:hypothetical protein
MAAPKTTLTPAQLVAAYVKLRDKKKAANEEFKKSMETTNKIMEQLEGILLEKLDELGADSLSSPEGTVYKNSENSATVQDAPTFREWIQRTDNWGAADLRANKKAVRELLEAGEEVPGVKFTTVFTVGVRRA